MDANIFNILISVLLLVFGFLLNRVFSEIDKLRIGHAETSASVTSLRVMLPTAYLGKIDFQRHEDLELKLIGEVQRDIREHFDKVDAMIVALHKRLDKDT